MTESHPTRGGARPGAGRPPISPDKRLVNFTIRIPAAWRDVIKQYHLLPVIRSAIEVLVNQAMEKKNNRGKKSH